MPFERSLSYRGSGHNSRRRHHAECGGEQDPLRLSAYRGWGHADLSLHASSPGRDLKEKGHGGAQRCGKSD
jgi:hypothetical protein